jgi:hypothetical protein
LVALALAVPAVAAGCDAGPATNASLGIGPPVHVISANISASMQLPANGTIELAFDRLLLPESITRQTFVMAITPPPIPSYDPITRIVSITPLTPLVVGQTYELEIASPQSSTDLSGLRAIDGATIDPSESVIDFQVSAPTAQTTLATIDFCTSVLPILGTCSGTMCHGGYLPAEGLELTTGAFVASTAIGRVAHEANTGPMAQPQTPGLAFGEDMPIIDPGSGGAGDPGDSWLLYKLLLAEVPPASPQAGPFDVQWQPLSDGERAILGNYVTGREMPYPATPSSTVSYGLSTADMETISLWIAQGATIPAACAGSGPGG